MPPVYCTALLPFSLCVMHQVFQKGMGVSLPLLDAYLDPVCLGMLGLYALSIERWYWTGCGMLSSLDILVTTAMLSVVSELVFPYYSSAFTADWLDVAGISFGACLFILIHNHHHYDAAQRLIQR